MPYICTNVCNLKGRQSAEEVTIYSTNLSINLSYSILVLLFILRRLGIFTRQYHRCLLPIMSNSHSNPPGVDALHGSASNKCILSDNTCDGDTLSVLEHQNLHKSAQFLLLGLDQAPKLSILSLSSKSLLRINSVAGRQQTCCILALNSKLKIRINNTKGIRRHILLVIIEREFSVLSIPPRKYVQAK